MVDFASDIFSIVSFVSVTIATSVWAFRRVWLNSANFEKRPKAFVRRIFRWGVQLGLDCWVGRGWEGRGCLEGALDLLTGVDVMARAGAPRGALRVFCKKMLFITSVGDRHFGAPPCFPHPGTCHRKVQGRAYTRPGQKLRLYLKSS